MCDDCWAKYGRPDDWTPDVQRAVELINAICEEESVCRPLYSVVENWNISGTITADLTLDYFSPEVEAAATELAEVLNRMPERERASALAYVDGHVDMPDAAAPGSGSTPYREEPPVADHKIRLSGGPAVYTVHLDGQDISSALSGVNVSIPKPGEPAVVTLDAAVWTIEDSDLDARVHIPNETRDLLVRLGWTPPRQKPKPTVHIENYAAGSPEDVAARQRAKRP